MMGNSEDYSLGNIKGIISVFTLIFSAILLFDLFLGVNVSEEKIEYRAYYKQQTGTVRNGGTKSVIGLITNKNEYPFREPSLYNIVRIGEMVEIYKSKILGEVTKIRFKDIDYKDSAYSIYTYYCLFPIVCIISSLLAVLLKKFQGSYSFFFLVLSSILTVFLLISMFTNNII